MFCCCREVDAVAHWARMLPTSFGCVGCAAGAVLGDLVLVRLLSRRCSRCRSLLRSLRGMAGRPLLAVLNLCPCPQIPLLTPNVEMWGAED